jgi:hypothetical protein
MAEPIGRTRWVIADGYIPGRSHGPAPQMESHETMSVLNAGEADAQLAVSIFFSDQEPIGPFGVTVPARRTRHFRFNELPIPHDTDYSALIESDQPVVVQHTRLDSRQEALALVTTIAYSAG